MIFFGMLVFGFGYVWLFVPETKGLTLEEVSSVCLSSSVLINVFSYQVDEMYRSKVPPWRSSEWKPSGRLQVHHDRSEKVTDDRSD
jgi:MFS transporter, SP family, sugar:H+ symporter